MKIRLQSFLRLFQAQPKKAKNGHSVNWSQDKVRNTIRQMDEFMELKQPYLQSGYNIKRLADELKIPSYQLSALLNRQVGSNFNDYLNRYRVKYCKGLIHEGSVSNLNLKGLSAKCGFSNRNTFTTAFKKFTGRTPSDYARNHSTIQEL